MSQGIALWEYLQEKKIETTELNGAISEIESWMDEKARVRAISKRISYKITSEQADGSIREYPLGDSLRYCLVVGKEKSKLFIRLKEKNEPNALEQDILATENPQKLFTLLSFTIMDYLMKHDVDVYGDYEYDKQLQKWKRDDKKKEQGMVQYLKENQALYLSLQEKVSQNTSLQQQFLLLSEFYANCIRITAQRENLSKAVS